MCFAQHHHIYTFSVLTTDCTDCTDCTLKIVHKNPYRLVFLVDFIGRSIVPSNGGKVNFLLKGDGCSTANCAINTGNSLLSGTQVSLWKLILGLA